MNLVQRFVQHLNGPFHAKGSRLHQWTQLQQEYLLIRMAGSTANFAMWRHRGSLDKNNGFSMLYQTFRLNLLYWHSLQ